MPNYRRAFVPGGSFFFTVVTYKRQCILTKPESLEILRKVVDDVMKKYSFTIDGWVLLPEHIHCIWSLPEDKQGAFYAPLTTLSASMSSNMKYMLGLDDMFLVRKTHPTIYINGGILINV